MEILNIGSVASIDFSDVRMSIDELQVFEAVLSHALETFSDEEIETKLGATRDEVEGIGEDVGNAISVSKTRSKELIFA